MCLDIPSPANDILRIFSLAGSILYFSYLVKNKIKKKNHIFSGFLGKFLLMIVCSKLTLCIHYQIVSKTPTT